MTYELTTVLLDVRVRLLRLLRLLLWSILTHVLSRLVSIPYLLRDLMRDLLSLLAPARLGRILICLLLVCLLLLVLIMLRSRSASILPMGRHFTWVCGISLLRHVAHAPSFRAILIRLGSMRAEGREFVRGLPRSHEEGVISREQIRTRLLLSFPRRRCLFVSSFRGAFAASALELAVRVGFGTVISTHAVPGVPGQYMQGLDIRE